MAKVACAYYFYDKYISNAKEHHDPKKPVLMHSAHFRYTLTAILSHWYHDTISEALHTTAIA